jgi:hypothetical protein
MENPEIVRIKRVAGIIAADAKNPDNQSRGREIIALAEMLERRLSGLAHDSDIR